MTPHISSSSGTLMDLVETSDTKRCKSPIPRSSMPGLTTAPTSSSSLRRGPSQDAIRRLATSKVSSITTLDPNPSCRHPPPELKRASSLGQQHVVNDLLAKKKKEPNAFKQKVSRTKSETSLRAMNRARDKSSGSTTLAKRGSAGGSAGTGGAEVVEMDLQDAAVAALERAHPSTSRDTNGLLRRSQSSACVTAREPGRLRVTRTSSKAKMLTRKLSEETVLAMEARSKKQASRRPTKDSKSHRPSSSTSNSEKWKSAKSPKQSPRRSGGVSPLKRATSTGSASSKRLEAPLPMSIVVRPDDYASYEEVSTPELAEPCNSTAWTCICGSKMKGVMKFCGMCATAQNWTCKECHFEKNICNFRFCGGCATPKPPLPSMPTIQLQDNAPASPSSPGSGEVASVGEE